jgi:hypothetical protein
MARLYAFLFALVSLFALGPTVLAASPSEEQCTAAGGTLTNENGTKVCAVPVGSSSNTKTTEGQGNLGNKTCTNGPGQGGGNKTC